MLVACRVLFKRCSDTTIRAANRIVGSKNFRFLRPGDENASQAVNLLKLELVRTRRDPFHSLLAAVLSVTMQKKRKREGNSQRSVNLCVSHSDLLQTLTQNVNLRHRTFRQKKSKINQFFVIFLYDTQDIDSKVCELARRELGIRRRKLVHDIYEEWNPASWVVLWPELAVPFTGLIPLGTRRVLKLSSIQSSQQIYDWLTLDLTSVMIDTSGREAPWLLLGVYAVNTPCSASCAILEVDTNTDNVTELDVDLLPERGDWMWSS